MSSKYFSEDENTLSDTINAIAANRVAQNAATFATWATSTALTHPELNATNPSLLPQPLLEMVEQSKTVPPWIFEKDSTHYNYARRNFEEEIATLASIDPNLFTATDDHELSEEIEHALVHILAVVVQNAHLFLHNVTRPNETDRRLVIDNLMNHSWTFEGSKKFVYRLACPVQLPSFGSPSIIQARPDSVAFFRIDASLTGYGTRTTKACSCLVSRNEPLWPYVAHWITEYKRETFMDASKRQVWMAMVSALYQRRSLGFEDQFVFGTAYHSICALDVFAGTWINRPDNSTVGQALSQTPKIVFYSLGSFDMSSTLSMVQFYLLARLVRLKASEYQVSINREARARIADIINFRPDIHSWPLANQARSNRSGEMFREVENNEAGPVGGEPDPNLAGGCDVKADRFDDPFAHQFAEEASEHAKVQSYLASSVHEHYDYEVSGDQSSYS